MEKQADQERFENEHQRLRVNLLVSCNWLRNEIKRFLKPYRITQKQYNILQVLSDPQPEEMAIEEIRSRMVDKMSDVSRILDRLIKKKLVEKRRSEADRRSFLVRITPAGRELVERVNGELPRLDQTTAAVNDDEARQLNQLLDKMRGT